MQVAYQGCHFPVRTPVIMRFNEILWTPWPPQPQQLNCFLDTLFELTSNKNESFALLAIVREIHRSSVDTSHQGLVTWKAFPLQWHHNEHDGVSTHQPYGCLLNRLFRRRSKNTPKLRVTGLFEGNSTVTKFPAQVASNAKNVSIWWRLMKHFNVVISSSAIHTHNGPHS